MTTTSSESGRQHVASKSRIDAGIQRRSAIIKAFSEMVAKNGYDAVSIRDIAELLNISKGTVVHHFQSKEQLLERVHFEYMTRRLAEMRTIFKEAERPLDRLACIIYQLVFAIYYDRTATIAFAREMVRFASTDNMREVRQLRHQYFSNVREVIEAGIDDGSFRAGDPALITFQIFGMTNWMWTWLRPDGSWTAEEIAESFTCTIIGGLSARVDAVEGLENALQSARHSAAQFASAGGDLPASTEH